jgi:hypothetical protein
MTPKEFDELFRKISSVYNLDTVAEKLDIKGNFPKRDSNKPIWECIDDLHHEEYIDIGNGKFFSCKFFFKRPIRNLFFILISEVEARLYRINERLGKPISELNEKNMNELIKNILSPKIITLQGEYNSRSKFKEDLKAISSFRNIIVHTNKKLQDAIKPDIVFERKKQVEKILIALQQISDNLAKGKT